MKANKLIQIKVAASRWKMSTGPGPYFIRGWEKEASFDFDRPGLDDFTEEDLTSECS